jgi:hypothetical protein
VQYATRDRSESFFSGGYLAEITVWAVWMSFFFTLFDKRTKKEILGSDDELVETRGRKPKYYLGFCLFITLICCLLTYPFLLLGYLIFYISGTHESFTARHFISPVIVFLSLNVLFTIWQYISDRRKIHNNTNDQR